MIALIQSLYYLHDVKKLINFQKKKLRYNLNVESENIKCKFQGNS